MKRLTVCILLLLVSFPALAQSPIKQGEQKANVYSFESWKPGTYSLSIVIGESGELVSMSSLTIISVPPPSIVPPPPPPPPTGSERVNRIKAVVPDDSETAKNLAGLSSVLATTVRAGKFQTVQQLSDTFKTLMTFILEDPARKQKWSAVWEATADGSEGVLADEWISVAQRGGNLDDYAALLEDISLALGGSSQLEAWDIQTIIEIVTLVMKPTKTMADYLRIAQLIMTLFAR